MGSASSFATRDCLWATLTVTVMVTVWGNSIFELQKFDIGSLLTITGLWPLSWIFTPTLRPTLCESPRLLVIHPYDLRLTTRRLDSSQ